MITIFQAQRIHNLLIDQFGGSKGIRDHEGLQSALSRPFQTFDHQPLYPGLIDKAAAVVESIISNHPFIDGNKRTGYVLMRLLLLQSNLDIRATEEEKYDFVIAIAAGDLDYFKILQWLNTHVVNASG